MKTTLAFLLLLTASSGHAYESPTHAGLTERAAIVSQLHARLQKLGAELGLYEPLTLQIQDNEDRSLERRFVRVDPEGGFVPDLLRKPGAGKGALPKTYRRQSALAWLMLGAVVEGVPSERIRHHFYDPKHARGLDQGEGLHAQFTEWARGTGSVRGLFTGTNFDGTGKPATTWVSAPLAENPWGIERFWQERERAVTLPTAEARRDALVRALVAAGSVAHVLQDLGSPSHVRNDYRESIEQQGAPFERYVAERYGRLQAPPARSTPLEPKHLLDLFHSPVSDGLSDFVAENFFSEGTLPNDLSAPKNRRGGYVKGPLVAHQAAYVRTLGGGAHWFLDERCHQDYAAILLPTIERFTLSLLERLFRGTVELNEEDDAFTISVLEIKSGELSVFVDDDKGNRLLVKKLPLAEKTRVEKAAGAKKMTLLAVGRDENGEHIIASVEKTMSAAAPAE